MTLDELNSASADAVREALKRCCGSEAWVKAMLRGRPFREKASLLSYANEAWQVLVPSEWLQAFAQHPKIGERATSTWSLQEQRGMQTATSDVAAKMQQLNVEYEQKFGYIFIVCATGKTAEEMLELLVSRLNNSAEAELRVAASEQAKITQLRLEKLLSE